MCSQPSFKVVAWDTVTGDVLLTSCVWRSLTFKSHKTSTGARAFTLVPRLFETTSRCLSVQLFQLLLLRNIWRHISLTWPFPHRCLHAWWPVDVTELYRRFCCWTLIRLSRHWVWLRWGYWRYRSLIDWLIDKMMWRNWRSNVSPSYP